MQWRPKFLNVLNLKKGGIEHHRSTTNGCVLHNVHRYVPRSCEWEPGSSFTVFMSSSLGSWGTRSQQAIVKVHNRNVRSSTSLHHPNAFVFARTEIIWNAMSNTNALGFQNRVVLRHENNIPTALLEALRSWNSISAMNCHIYRITLFDAPGDNAIVNRSFGVRVFKPRISIKIKSS